MYDIEQMFEYQALLFTPFTVTIRLRMEHKKGNEYTHGKKANL